MSEGVVPGQGVGRAFHRDLAQIEDEAERKALQRQIARMEMKRNIAIDARRKFARD